MKSPASPLSMEIAKYWEHHPKHGDIGIEIEVEGEGLMNGLDKAKYWKVVPEPSLRGGAEFVLIDPVPIKDLSKVMDNFEAMTTKAKFVPSLRTSVHVHINVSTKTLLEVYTALSAYWIVENALIRLNGSFREGNLHCLRARDAEAFIRMVAEDVIKGSHFHQTGSDSMRYSAVNLAALHKFGSLEFRFIRGTTDRDEIETWAKQLYAMVHNAMRYETPSKVLKAFNEMPIQYFLGTLFDPSFVPRLNLPHHEFTQNVPLIYEMASALKQKPGSKIKSDINEDMME